MKMGIATRVITVCLAGAMVLSSCGAGGKSEAYKKAMETYNKELAKERVPWTTPEGQDTSISTRAFKFALLDINPGKVPDLVLLKDTGRNFADDGMGIVATSYNEGAFQIQQVQEFEGYYPNTGIYTTLSYMTDEDGTTYIYNLERKKVIGKVERYFYLPDCSEKDTDSINLNAMTLQIGERYLIEDNADSYYEWYGIYDSENRDEYVKRAQGEGLVSKDEFEENLKKYIGNTKLVEVFREDFHDNTEENRKEYFK